MKKTKIGLLPFWIELYDNIAPEAVIKSKKFADEIADIFISKEILVSRGSVCRLENEFNDNIRQFEKEDVDAIVTLHLAYSPSLESIGPLLATKLPIIVLDTTPAYDFSHKQSPDEIMFNHGIHGVQDMCSMLKRYNRPYLIEAGHYIHSDVINRVISCIKAAKMAKSMMTARVGKVGRSFSGMGDFSVSDEQLLSSIGPKVICYDFKSSPTISEKITDEMIQQEISEDHKMFNVAVIDPVLHQNASHSGLMLRNFIESNDLTAITVNFMEINKASGFLSMPFLELSKAMARGIGYAGEGDTLTAAFVGAIMSAGFEASFTEMFCPDWEHESVFLSHMGEMNLSLCAEKPVLSEKQFIFTDTGNTVFAWSRFKKGRAVFANLAPSGNGKYTLILSPGQIKDVDSKDNMTETIHGWFSPDTALSDFLKKFSLVGGTHHSALIYGEVIEELEAFGRLMGWETLKI